MAWEHVRNSGNTQKEMGMGGKGEYLRRGKRGITWEGQVSVYNDIYGKGWTVTYVSGKWWTMTYIWEGLGNNIPGKAWTRHSWEGVVSIDTQWHIWEGGNMECQLRTKDLTASDIPGMEWTIT